jgi:hypothetical protein
MTENISDINNEFKNAHWCRILNKYQCQPVFDFYNQNIKYINCVMFTFISLINLDGL